MSAESNLLVISDLHLGEDLRPVEMKTTEKFNRIIEDLAAFLDHHGERPRGGRRWRLVINGDMVDLISILLRPGEVGLETAGDDEIYGLGSHKAASLAKLSAAVRRSDAFFSAVARFLARGHDAAVVVGNHDAELFWPDVQERFRELVVARVVPVEGGESAVTVGARLEFYPWFLLEDGLAWIEHGHQYDAYCSVDCVLDPIDPVRPEELEQNVGSAVMRYLANHLPGDPESYQDKPFTDYLATLGSQSRDLAGFLLAGYFRMTRRLYAQTLDRVFRPTVFATRTDRHRALLRGLAKRSGISERTLLKLARLRKRPVYTGFAQLQTALMLGRLLVLIGALVGAPLLLLTLPIAWWPWAILGGVVLFFALQALAAAGRESVDPRASMREAAQRIRGLSRAPVVVFGHTHVPEAHRLRDGGWYFNTGTWASGPERNRSYTHLIVERPDQPEGEVRASLCQWREGRSWELRTEVARRGARRRYYWGGELDAGA